MTRNGLTRMSLNETRAQAIARRAADKANAQRRKLKNRHRKTPAKPPTVQAVAVQQEAVLRIVRQWFAFTNIPSTGKAGEVLRDMPGRVRALLREATEEIGEPTPKPISKTKKRIVMRKAKAKVDRIFNKADERATFTAEKVNGLPWLG